MTEKILAMLPAKIAGEICRVGRGYRAFEEALSEIRLRAGARSSLLVDGENLPLSAGVDEGEMDALVKRLCHGSLYAFRDTITSGYLPMEGGVRVGVCGQARYEGGRLVGISEIRSLVFRIPHPVCDFAEQIGEIWEEGRHRGMLIYSPPGGGKTTALRALAAKLGKGAAPKRVVVIDERCEFLPEDYREATVDLMRGYDRVLGMEIATRTMTPEVLMVDEIGGAGEARALLPMLRTGVPFIATAHAESYADVCRRPALLPLVEEGIFDVFCGIRRTAAGRFLDVDRVLPEGSTG